MWWTFAKTVDLQVVAALLAAVGIAAAALLKVWLDHKRQPAGPTPGPCPLQAAHAEQITDLHDWHKPDDRATGRQSWKVPAGQYETIRAIAQNVIELRNQLNRVEQQLGSILEPYRPSRKDPTIP